MSLLTRRMHALACAATHHIQSTWSALPPAWCMHFSLHPPDHRGFGPQYIRFSRPLQALQPAAATKKTLFHSWTITGGYCAIRVRGAGPIRSAGRREHFSSPPPPSEYDSFAPPARRKHFSLSPPPSEYDLFAPRRRRRTHRACPLPPHPGVWFVRSTTPPQAFQLAAASPPEYDLFAPRRRRRHFSLSPRHPWSSTHSLQDRSLQAFQPAAAGSAMDNDRGDIVRCDTQTNKTNKHSLLIELENGISAALSNLFCAFPCAK